MSQREDGGFSKMIASGRTWRFRAIAGIAALLVGLGLWRGPVAFGRVGREGALPCDQRGVRPPSPIDLSLAKLRADPFRYAGQRVRVTGRLDECYGHECALCPSEMTNATAHYAQCLPLSFQPIMKGTAFGATAKEALFRYLTVTIEATVDATCLRVPCPDRNSILVGADAVEVVKRRASRFGLRFGATTRLRAIGDAQAAAIFAAGRRSGLLPSAADEVAKSDLERLLERQASVGWHAGAFAVEGRRDVVLLCVAGSKDDGWPDSLEAALYAKSIDDRYECHAFRKIGLAWVAQVDDSGRL